MADVLPRFFAVRFSGKYLRYVVEDGEFHGCLEFSGEEVATPYTRFEVVKAESSTNMVHIRCCYNKKFWRKRSPKVDDFLIIVGANDPDENQSDWGCTLITPHHIEATIKECSFTFPSGLSLHPTTPEQSPNLKNRAFLSAVTPAAVAATAAGNTFNIINLTDAVVLPRYVVFKGDNGRYLRSKILENHNYLEFDAAHDDASFIDPEVRYEIFPTSDGNVRIKSLHFNKFWRRDTPNPNNWVWADSTDTGSSNRNTVFQPLSLASKNKIGLKCLGNNLFCVRNPDKDWKTNCLDAKDAEAGLKGEIEVAEAVVSREIYGIQFKLDDARRSERRVSQPVVVFWDNWDPVNSVKDKEFEFTVEEIQKNTWTSTNSWKVGVATTIKTGIPLIAEGKITIEAEYEGSIEWSETKEKSQKYAAKVISDVSPMTKLVMTKIQREVTADIPFFYSQRDVLLDGTVKTTRMEDGLYSTIETINDFTSQSEPLSA